MDILVLGSGTKIPQTNKDDRLVTVDISPLVGASVVHDLNQFPWPFEDNSFDTVHLDNVLEHLSDITRVMEEIHRVSRPQAQVLIIVPYFRSIWACVDPTHLHFFTVNTLSYYIKDHVYNTRYKYSSRVFTLEDLQFNQYIDKSWFRRLVLPFANRYPLTYETYFSHLYPMEDLTYHLRVSK